MRQGCTVWREQDCGWGVVRASWSLPTVTVADGEPLAPLLGLPVLLPVRAVHVADDSGCISSHFMPAWGQRVWLEASPVLPSEREDHTFLLRGRTGEMRFLHGVCW